MQNFVQGIVFANAKGNSGKTISSANIARYMVKSPNKVFASNQVVVPLKSGGTCILITGKSDNLCKNRIRISPRG